MEADPQDDALPEDVLAMSSPSSNAPGSPPLFDLNLILQVEVEVFIPMENGVQLQINPDEFPEDELMGHEDEMVGQHEDAMEIVTGNQSEEIELIGHQSVGSDIDASQATASGQHNHLHLGFVELLEPAADPVYEQFTPPRAMPPDFFRLWSKHFNPTGNSSAIDIPPEWAAFFTAALLNPKSFDWAKRFLSSPAWAFFSNSTANSYSFTLHTKCPTKDILSCFDGSGQGLISSLEDMVDFTAEPDEALVD